MTSFFLLSGSAAEKIQLLNKNNEASGCKNCSITKAQVQVPVVKKEISVQTEEIAEKKEIDVSTQTKTQWLQISLNSPPLSLTQEVPDVVL